MNADQVASGVAVLPVRTETTMVVPVGTSAFQVTAPAFTTTPASNTRDVNVPLAPNGLIRTQFRLTTLGSPTVTSLKSGRMAAVGDAVWVATTTPSTWYTTPVVVQSIRNRCGAVGLMPVSVVRVVAVAEVRVSA